MSMSSVAALERPPVLMSAIAERLRDVMSSRGGRLRLAALAASLLAFGGEQIVVRRGGANRLAPTTAAPAPVNPWVEVRHPLRFYSLETQEFGREPTSYEARRRAQGGGREDTLTLGAASPGDKRGMLVSVYRRGAEEAGSDRFFVEVARQAARQGLSVAHAAQPGDMKTRFGVFEVADISLAGKGGEAACLGFRLDRANPALRISGYACGTPARPIDRRELACTIDRLDLVSVGEDRALGRFFAESQLARGAGCGGAQGVVKQRASWLDGPGERPALRGDLAARSRR